MSDLVSTTAEAHAWVAMQHTLASEPVQVALANGLAAAAPLIVAQAFRQLANSLCPDCPNCSACYETRELLLHHANNVEEESQK